MQASYALGYNLAIEYLADYEKTWMLDSFRVLNKQVLEPQGRPLSCWHFLEVRQPRFNLFVMILKTWYRIGSWYCPARKTPTGPSLAERSFC